MTQDQNRKQCLNASILNIIIKYKWFKPLSRLSKGQAELNSKSMTQIYEIYKKLHFTFEERL